VDQGFLIRELPDGSTEFVLDEPDLTSITIDRRSTLHFGDAALSIGAPFTLVSDRTTHVLDPEQRDALGPLVALYPSTVRWLWTTPQGELTVVFGEGVVLRVAPHPVVRAWTVGTVVCLPTGAR
jgi:hypothetical protein